MSMQSWAWPEGVSVDLFYWSWMANSSQELIHGWSLAGITDPAGNVTLEAERNQPPGTFHVNQAGSPDVRWQTFRSASELPFELIDNDGTPLPWLRQLIDCHTTPHPEDVRSLIDTVLVVRPTRDTEG